MKKLLTFTAAVTLVLLSSCTTHYQLTAIDRQRILIDKSYDAMPDKEAAAMLAPYKAKVDEVMSPVVGTVAHDMAAVRPESDLSNLLPDIFMAAAEDYGEKPDFAVYNMGGIRAALTKGQVTFGDVIDVAPFDNKICFLTLTGEKVMELFRQIAMRGGEGVSHGVELVMSADRKLLSAKLNGKEIDPQATYRLTTIDYLAEGNDQLTAFKSGTNVNKPTDEKCNARFVIVDYFKKKMEAGQSVASKVEGRIKVKNVE